MEASVTESNALNTYMQAEVRNFLHRNIDLPKTMLRTSDAAKYHKRQITIPKNAYKITQFFHRKSK